MNFIHVRPHGKRQLPRHAGATSIAAASVPEHWQRTEQPHQLGLLCEREIDFVFIKSLSFWVFLRAAEILSQLIQFQIHFHLAFDSTAPPLWGTKKVIFNPIHLSQYNASEYLGEVSPSFQSVKLKIIKMPEELYTKDLYYYRITMSKLKGM